MRIHVYLRWTSDLSKNLMIPPTHNYFHLRGYFKINLLTFICQWRQYSIDIDAWPADRMIWT